MTNLPTDHPCFSEEEFDLSKIKLRLLNQGWSAARVNKAVEEYRRFMYLIVNDSVGSKSVPSKEVDEVWHAHILHTALYAKHCRIIGDHFIHHQPSNLGTKEVNEDRQLYIETLQKYKSAFGIDPSPDVWPLICIHECDECHSIECRGTGTCNSQCAELCTGGPGNCEGHRSLGF